MPKAKAVETAGKGLETILLKMGKANNVIQWRVDMYNLATEEFGEVGTQYFYTNVGYKYPFSHEREYNPFYVEPLEEAAADEAVDDEEGDEEEDEADVEEDIGVIVEQPEAVPVPRQLMLRVSRGTRLALINKLRKGTSTGGRTPGTTKNVVQNLGADVTTIAVLSQGRDRL
jgi:hypothetical protein